MRWWFNDLSHFSRAFRQQFGLSPRNFRLVHASQSGNGEETTREDCPHS
jgi:AraC-like DNA-binding protein